MTDKAITKHEPQVPTATPEALIRLATEQGAGIEVIERMAALYERERADQRRKAYHEALAQFQAACPDIRRHDSSHTSKYARLERIVKAIKPALRDAGLTYRYEIEDSGETLAVSCIITHVDGHDERTTMHAKPDNSGKKNEIQSRGSAVTYLQRYTLCGALGLVTVDEDDDGGAPVSAITPEQAQRLGELVRESKTDLKAMLAWAGCDSLDSFPESRYNEAVKTCRRKMADAEELPI